MPAAVSMQEVLRELHGLAGVYPSISVQILDENRLSFYAQTQLIIAGGRSGRYDYATGTDECADVAILKAYERLFTLGKNEWIESAQTGTAWMYDPDMEGWRQRTEYDAQENLGDDEQPRLRRVRR